MAQFPAILPRLIRLRDAPFYLGMDRNRFNTLVRPQLAEVPIGKQGIAFDRLDLDAWVDDYITRNGRLDQPNGGLSWDARKPQDSSNAAISGISTKKCEVDARLSKYSNFKCILISRFMDSNRLKNILELIENRC